MKYRVLGRTGMLVSEFALGTMTFGTQQDSPAIGGLSQRDADALVDTALNHGVNLFDTADVYANGESERILGKALKDRRADVLIATKAAARVGPGPNSVGSSRAHLLKQVDSSLERLGTDYIDLFQVHLYDPLTPVEEIARTLDDLVSMGAVRWAGCSNFSAWQVMKANAAAVHLDRPRFESIQVYYSLVGRGVEREVAPLAVDQELSLLVWSPLAGGFLSGKYGRDAGPRDGRRTTFDFPPVDVENGLTVVDVLRKIGERRGLSAAAISLAWLLKQPAVTSVILGAKRVSQLEENLRASEVTLEADELEELDRVSRLPSEYPGWVLDLELWKRDASG